MVRNIITLLFVVLTNKIVFAQTPQKMSFQSVIRDELDNIVANNPIGMQISILKGSQKVYTENQMGTTNSNGLISFIIGNGTVVLGNFSNIDWGDGSYFIEIDTDPTGGTAYSIKSSSQLLSVPYALYAKTAEQIDKSTSTVQIDSLKSIINQGKEPQDATFWLKGDAKVDGKVIVNKHQIIYVPDQLLFDGSLVIGTGGLNLSTSPPISPNGYDENLGKQNTFVGIEAGRDNASGNQNTFIGTWAGILNTVGDQNTFVGMNAGSSNTTGWHSTYVGAWAGYQNTIGRRNAFFGTDAGNYNTTGSENSFFGGAAGVFNKTGEMNSFFGLFAGTNNNGDGNSFFGRSAGFEITTGSYNTFVGNDAGYHPLQKKNAINSIALGNATYTTKDNQIVIGNSNTIETLLNGKIGIGNQFKNISTYGISLGSDNSAIEFVGSNWGVGYGHLIHSVDSYDGIGVDLRIAGRLNSTIWTDLITIKNNGNVSLGNFTGAEIKNNKLSVDGNIYANGTITATAGKSTDWNAAYSWGNHKDLYKPINYTPDWFEISSNPFVFTSIADNQLLKYNSITSKWENWTPNYLTSFTEADPSFTVWNKTSGISITASQVSDFQTSVTNNAAVLANTAKNSYPTVDAIKLAGIAAGAQVNVNADWNATSGDAQILNKPEISKGSNIGDMQYWNGTSWVIIPAGQPGQFLQFTTENKPAWITVLPN